jgi:hypothetical protein
MDLNISDAQLDKLIAESIMQKLTPETREQLLVSAIDKLLRPESPYGGAPKASPLQQAFANAVQNIARDIAHEKLSNDERVKAQVESILADAAKLALSDGRQQLVEKIANLIRSSIVGDRY